MDSQLPNNLTQGSALLGYGETKRSYVKYVAAFFAVTGILALIVLSTWALLSPLPMPEDTLLTIALPGKIVLPEFAPDIWRRAAATGQPTMLGVSKKQDGLGYFAVAPRWAKSEGAQTISSGLLKTFVDSDNQTVTKKGKAYTFFSQTLIKARGNEAYMTLQLDRGSDSRIAGVITDSTWRTDLKISESKDDIVLDDGNFINLKEFPAAWQKIDKALADRFDLELQDVPSAVGWQNLDSEDYSLTLIFNEQMTDKTLDALYAAAGQSRTGNYRLADGSIASELLTPDSAADKEEIAAIGLPLEVTLNEKNLIFKKYSPSTNLSTCGEKPLAAIDISYLQDVFSNSTKNNENAGRLIFSVDKGNLSVCYQVINR